MWWRGDTRSRAQSRAQRGGGAQGDCARVPRGRGCAGILSPVHGVVVERKHGASREPHDDYQYALEGIRGEQHGLHGAYRCAERATSASGDCVA